METIKNIFVAVDFDERAETLLADASNFAKMSGAKVWIVHIAAPDPYFVGYKSGPEYIRKGRADDLRKEHKALQEYAASLEAGGIEVESLLIQGPTVEMILEETSKLKIDLIVMGHHEHSFIYKTFFGSSTVALIKKSTIPILVVPFE